MLSGLAGGGELDVSKGSSAYFGLRHQVMLKTRKMKGKARVRMVIDRRPLER